MMTYQPEPPDGRFIWAVIGLTAALFILQLI